MEKVQLSDLSEMDAEERNRTYDQIMRVAARPEQCTRLQPSSLLLQHESVVRALSQLGQRGQQCLTGAPDHSRLVQLSGR